MRRRLSTTLLLAFLLHSLTAAQANTISVLKAKADSLFKNFDEEGALQVYEQILEKHPADYETLWKASLLYSRVGYRLEAKDDQEKFYSKAKMMAEQALKHDRAGTNAHFAMAVAWGRMAQISGARDRVAASKVIKKHVDQSIKADSTNSGAWHILGRWHFKIANLSFIERLAANTLYGGIPRDASNGSAEEAIKKAIELNPRYPLYYYDLALVFDERGEEEQAMKTCREALKLEPAGPDDKRHKENCRELIRDLQ